MGRRLQAATVLLLAVGAGACSADDSPGAVTVELRSARDSYPAGTAPTLTLAVHNNSDAACAVPKHGIGSLRVVSVHRDGVDVPSTSRAILTIVPAVDAVRAALGDLAPEESQALDVEVGGGTGSPAAIRSHTVAASGGMTATIWPVTERGRYRVTAALEIPPRAARPDRAPLCAPADSASVEFTVE
ncbi:hypothetical protein SAMN04488550_1869 [Gordonia malaquae]|uniref:DUF4232 domain-containing protein n=1 Tax=Gordonia malaquae NBRC 108250 TaxID=1223542 RepID=M3VB87_GORML|nr:hypothetical protein [Gordonia malaquae]GAC79833.1 hypothetical protein GM1_012_01060 [Gordonia malaquae NBRC 108250]SEC46736.1 hypothetical protein SAMN04488550_1869 [Gordonia malaquae]